MTSSSTTVQVIGGGLAGTEAAWQVAQAGIPVILHEMRPIRTSPAHHSQELAELVCSNSFGAMSSDRAAGLLHEELRRLNSIIIQTADKHAVPAGGALAVDRGVFSQQLTQTLATHPLIELRRSEVQEIHSDGIVILATGPLTSPVLAEHLQQFTVALHRACDPLLLQSMLTTACNRSPPSLRPTAASVNTYDSL